MYSTTVASVLFELISFLQIKYKQMKNKENKRGKDLPIRYHKTSILTKQK